MNNIKLIGIDMDGTLLNSRKEVSEKTREALMEASQKGINIVIATGRVYSNARFFARYTGLRTPIIACNGAVIKDSKRNELIYSSPMTMEDVFTCMETADKYKVRYHIFAEDAIYGETFTYSSKSYTEWNKQLPEEDRIEIIITDRAEMVRRVQSEQILKVVISDENPALLHEIRDELNKKGTMEVSSSWYNNLEVMKAGVSKGKALDYLASRYGIAREQVMAFGDSENDLSMLTYAGVGVAMGNGIDRVKEAVKFVTLSNDEDGVAHGIRRLALGHQGSL